MKFSESHYLKRPKNFIKGEMMPIYLRITVKGKHSEYSVGREIIPSFWSALKGKGTGLREDIRELNDYLDTLASKVRRFHTTLEKFNFDNIGRTELRKWWRCFVVNLQLITGFEVTVVLLRTLIQFGLTTRNL
ncbi:hypothetical protein EZ456_00990 [Pedobacter psychrodurus]|uniref:Arm DNA-binding domain-containing protein n=1 Tax=Pedobacter psychrodurus TaxID=2530456 RepID=A0A4R0Q2U6_9SPHI|nr:Arm DNA-binding domain-containing protein [Pedobacter psychrodurus]TCD29623.1 hypothetical protein EZ456_00990 [Pedobacter psychrodurus]